MLSFNFKILFFLLFLAGIGFIAFNEVKIILCKRNLKNDNTTDYYHDKYSEKLQKHKFFRKIYVIALPIVIVVFTFFSSFYILNEQETQAVVETFGKPTLINGAGFHWKYPWISNVTKINTTIKSFSIGYIRENDEIIPIEEESLMITSDFNLVNVDFYVSYQVVDAIDFLYGCDNPEEILKNICQSAIRNTIGLFDVDSVLTTGKSEIQAAIKEDVIKELSETHTGLQLVNIDIQDAEPPTEEVQQAFKDVEDAIQKAESAINNADQYSNEQIPAANAKADKINQDADAKKQERIDSANAEIAVFNAMYDEYQKNPDSTKLRMYYESMETLLPHLHIIVNGTDDEISNYFINGTTNNSTTTEKEK